VIQGCVPDSDAHDWAHHFNPVYVPALDDYALEDNFNKRVVLFPPEFIPFLTCQGYGGILVEAR